MVGRLSFPTPHFHSDLRLISGLYARAGLTHCGGRPGSAGKGRSMAHVPELRRIVQRVDGDKSELEARSGSCAWIQNRPEDRRDCIWGGVHRREEREDLPFFRE